MAFETLKKLMRLLDQMDQVPTARAVQEGQARLQVMEQRVNLLEAHLQTQGSNGKAEEQARELRAALEQLSAALQSTVGLLQKVQESQRRNEENLKTVQEKVAVLERSVQAMSIRSA